MVDREHLSDCRRSWGLGSENEGVEDIRFEGHHMEAAGVGMGLVAAVEGSNLLLVLEGTAVEDSLLVVVGREKKQVRRKAALVADS